MGVIVPGAAWDAALSAHSAPAGPAGGGSGGISRSSDSGPPDADISVRPGWGGHSRRLHWIRDGQAICGEVLLDPTVEPDAGAAYLREYACRRCRRKLEREAQGE